MSEEKSVNDQLKDLRKSSDNKQSNPHVKKATNNGPKFDSQSVLEHAIPEFLSGTVEYSVDED